MNDEKPHKTPTLDGDLQVPLSTNPKVLRIFAKSMYLFLCLIVGVCIQVQSLRKSEASDCPGPDIIVMSHLINSKDTKNISNNFLEIAKTPDKDVKSSTEYPLILKVCFSPKILFYFPGLYLGFVSDNKSNGLFDNKQKSVMHIPCVMPPLSSIYLTDNWPSSSGS
ncbi:hypothetical protein STEG23_018596, partial [Scotinomys teguina]